MGIQEGQEEQKFSFRQRWFPTFDDAEDLMKSKYKKIEKYYSTLMFPMKDFLGRWARSLVVGSALLYGACQGIGNNVKVADSTYNGDITSFGREGLLFKTWEGSFAVGGDQRSISGYFSLDESMDGQIKNGLSSKLQDAAKNRTPVRIRGIKYMATWPWRSGTNYLLQSVDPLDSSKK